jgi:hypothetical protein
VAKRMPADAAAKAGFILLRRAEDKMNANQPF